MPALGLGVLGLSASGPVAATGELIRHAAYGALLGWIYPIFRSRRPVRMLPHTPEEVPPKRVAPAGAD